MTWSETPVETATELGLAMLGVGLLLSFVRLAVGPTLADRVVALDMVAMLLVGLLALGAVAAPRTEALRVAIVLALVNFLGTVTYAVYVRNKADR